MTAKDDRTSRASSEQGEEAPVTEKGTSGTPGAPAAEPAAAVPRQWHYPSADEHPTDEIFIYDKWCKSCGICYSVCPKGVLTSDKAGRPVVAHPEACIACGLCEILCPDMAITVYKKRGGAANESDGTKEAGAEGESGGSQGAVDE